MRKIQNYSNPFQNNKVCIKFKSKKVYYQEQLHIFLCIFPEKLKFVKFNLAIIFRIFNTKFKFLSKISANSILIVYISSRILMLFSLQKIQKLYMQLYINNINILVQSYESLIKSSFLIINSTQIIFL